MRHDGTAVRADEFRTQAVAQLAQQRIAPDAGGVTVPGCHALCVEERDGVVVGRHEGGDLGRECRAVRCDVDADRGRRIFFETVRLTPATMSVNVFVVLVAAMLLIRIAASVACTALSAAESPDTPSLLLSPNVTPAPPERALLIVKALDCPVNVLVSASRWLLALVRTTVAVTPMPAVVLIASARPCNVVLPVMATATPPIVIDPPLAAIVVFASASDDVDTVVCVRASSFTTTS